MIIATAGHIDHGKTSLVKILSGVDTDRLPEEKKRGLSIDLGFAYHDTGEETLGFVDVPGHEKFVRNMIAGVSGIDFALLVIAADDGIMPQTREHLAILDLLEISAGAVALTKIDRVGEERLAEVQKNIEVLLAETDLADLAVFPLSSVTGQGVDGLRGYLTETAKDIARAKTSGAFRMSIDRAFIIEGAGIVVTGLALSGEVAINGRLLLSPSGQEVRVRGIHAQNRKADLARAGERCALNISAPRLTLSSIARGDWLLDSSLHAPTSRFDARIRLLASEEKPLRHWTPAHLHIGAADVPARLAVLQDGPIEPGQDGFVQIVLPRPVSALHGDCFVLRDQSATRTIAGGSVIDPSAPDRGRAKPERLEVVAALGRGHAAAALASALARAPRGLPFSTFCLARNLDSEQGAALAQSVDAVIVGPEKNQTAFVNSRWSELLDAGKNFFQAHHKNNQGAAGLTIDVIRSHLNREINPDALPALLDALIATSAIEFVSGAYRLAGTHDQLEPKDQAVWEKIQPLLDDKNLRPPSVAEIAQHVNQDARAVERLLNKAARVGLVTQVARNRYYLPERLRQLGDIATNTARDDADNVLQVRAFRDSSGIGRNLVIEVLEYFDRLGFTRRAGDHRTIVKQVSDINWSRGRN